MPFQNHGNRAYTHASVSRNAPAASGVYGLADSRQWLYVGEAANIQAALLAHLLHPTPFLANNIPAGFTFELSPPEERTQRRNRLVVELEPLGNHG